MHSPKLAASDCGSTTEESASVSDACCLIPRTKQKNNSLSYQESTLQMSPITATLDGIVNSQYLGLFKYFTNLFCLTFLFDSSHSVMSILDFTANESSSKMFSSFGLFSYYCHFLSVFKCPCSSMAPWPPWTYLWWLFLNQGHAYLLSCFPREHYCGRTDFRRRYSVLVVFHILFGVGPRHLKLGCW